MKRVNVYYDIKLEGVWKTIYLKGKVNKMSKEILAAELRRGKRFECNNNIIFYNEGSVYNGKSPYCIKHKSETDFESVSLLAWERDWQEIVTPKRELCTIEQLMYHLIEKPRAFRYNMDSPWSINHKITENIICGRNFLWCDLTPDGFGEPHHFYKDEMGLV